MFVNMTRRNAARLIRDLATMLAETDTDNVQLRVAMEDRKDWTTGETIGTVIISGVRYPVLANGTAFVLTNGARSVGVTALLANGTAFVLANGTAADCAVTPTDR